ncbi:hypothetical protein SPHINGO361_140224 [Sphingomonas sp. EC-HK361]|nr:hypothetical protein SPHINGO361_140224 [Sphingomonas sp. EC-HK361]
MGSAAPRGMDATDGYRSLFKVPDLMAERRLHISKLLCCPGKMPFLQNGQERTDMPQLHIML